MEAAIKKTEHGLERNRFRRNTRQFRIFPTTPTTRRTPNIIVRYCWMRARILVIDDISISIMKVKSTSDFTFCREEKCLISTVDNSKYFSLLNIYARIKKEP